MNTLCIPTRVCVAVAVQPQHILREHPARRDVRVAAETQAAPGTGQEGRVSAQGSHTHTSSLSLSLFGTTMRSVVRGLVHQGAVFWVVGGELCFLTSKDTHRMMG